ncbi:hypothetical protein DRE_04562 [Drechslerella stenobrocha 248]|uniref:Uncharacterized protein n=1 Tax=Drechslerella stenobrocha 248 TaxID=1043628 RepID=W7HSH6_9PEZI|nr:hypothetical protein DRE_04562 [Drechslerella stenobrocha 248]
MFESLAPSDGSTEAKTGSGSQPGLRPTADLESSSSGIGSSSDEDLVLYPIVEEDEDDDDDFPGPGSALAGPSRGHTLNDGISELTEGFQQLSTDTLTRSDYQGVLRNWRAGAEAKKIVSRHNKRIAVLRAHIDGELDPQLCGKEAEEELAARRPLTEKQKQKALKEIERYKEAKSLFLKGDMEGAVRIDEYYQRKAKEAEEKGDISDEWIGVREGENSKRRRSRGPPPDIVPGLLICPRPYTTEWYKQQREKEWREQDREGQE